MDYLKALNYFYENKFLDILAETYTNKNYAFLTFNNRGKDYISEFSKGDTSIIIGGSLGISPKVLQASNELICFSKMTFPHQLIRIFLLEQIYRAFKISNNETYHK